ncbi:MAG: hypothetical protein D6765_06100 [Bacteroidetes bacterium]|nr:MAG: hypothetical protein D6765_06100 [Bacteroidota bacterium]
MKKLPLFVVLWQIVFLGACVSSKKYNSLEQEKAFFEQEYHALKEVESEREKCEQENRFLNAQLRQNTRQLEELTIRARQLEKDYADLSERYDRLLNQNQRVLTTASYEKRSLEEALAAKEAELDEKERRLEALEYTLRQREQYLSQLQANQGEWERKVQELETLVQTQRAQMQQLRESIAAAVLNFSEADLSVEERDGQLHLSLSQNLLFKKGSDKLDWKGKKALIQLAEILKNHPDIDIVVEGHTDDTGNAALNWDLSVKRATSVVKVLTAHGVDPHRVTAAGRAFFDPVAPNDSEENRARNRRTEIILSPKLEQVFQLLKG